MANQTQDSYTSSVQWTSDHKKNHTGYGKLDWYTPERVLWTKQCLCQETSRYETSHGTRSLLAKAKTNSQKRQEGDTHTQENAAWKYQTRIITVSFTHSPQNLEEPFREELCIWKVWPSLRKTEFWQKYPLKRREGRSHRSTSPGRRGDTRWLSCGGVWSRWVPGETRTVSTAMPSM